jgi:hypothetical protein
VRDLMYLPFAGLMKKMRDQMGFRSLTDKYDASVNYWSLLRNCLLHNHGRADIKLARAQLSSLSENEKIILNAEAMHKAIGQLRFLAYEIDRAFEQIS